MALPVTESFTFVRAAGSDVVRLGVMAHAKLFDEDDPFLGHVRELVHRLPEVAEKVSHGRPAFYTGKVFCYYGGSLKVDGEWIQHPHAVMILPDADERRALAEDPRVFVPAYLGPSGWLGFDLDEHTDWAEVAELFDMSYRLTAPKRAVTQLDAQA